MKICVWQAAPDVPTSQAWLARFLIGKGFSPVFITASTEEAVRKKAQAFWDAEVEKHQRNPRKKPDTDVEGVTQQLEAIGKFDAVEEGVAQTDTLPRYFYHPESDSLMQVIDGSDPRVNSDGLVEEIDRAEYDRISALQLADVQQEAILPTVDAAPTATDDLDDLLG